MTIDAQSRLRAVARAAMSERGFDPDTPPAAIQEAERLAPAGSSDTRRDLRHLLWASIDNDSSMDLDQLSVCEPLASGRTRVLVAIADVDACVTPQDPIDQHAKRNATTVYTPSAIFSMLPERLSTNVTSLAENADRAAVVVDLTVTPDGFVTDATLYPALVRNLAKLAYSSVGAWLEGRGEIPPRISGVAGLADNLRAQSAVAQALKQRRHEQGALTLHSSDARAVFSAGSLQDIVPEPANRATELIEDFMIAANVATAQFLASKGVASLRRVVRVPERWPRLVALAARNGDRLPAEPNGPALEAWLLRRQAADPDHFPDLSLSVVKLLGRGEYVVERPGAAPVGHFGLAVHDYTHATAPNRRFADLVTQRLIKAAAAGGASPYSEEELTALAVHCTDREDEANHVERQVQKAAVALLLSPRIGDTFDALVTGVNTQGTWVRIRQPPGEGRLDHMTKHVDVGDSLRVRLTSVNVDRGFVDFDPA
jgi:exoribonuclease-2